MFPQASRPRLKPGSGTPDVLNQADRQAVKREDSFVSSYGTTDNHMPAPIMHPAANVSPGTTHGQPRPTSTYHPGRAFRFASSFMTTLLRAGLPMGSNYLLTLPGRKSGAPRTNPVTIVEYEGERWLTSPFGEVDWVRNLRAAGGKATLRRGRRTEVLFAEEVSAADAAPLFKWLLTETRLPSAVRNQYHVPPDATLADYEEEARYHPVFHLSATPVA